MAQILVRYCGRNTLLTHIRYYGSTLIPTAARLSSPFSQVTDLLISNHGYILPRRLSTPSDTDTSSSSAAGLVDTVITNERVVLFSAIYCPFCSAAKDIFHDLDVTFTAFELDQGPSL